MYPHIVLGISFGILIGLVSGLVTVLVLHDVKLPTGRYSFMERIFGRRKFSGVRLSAKIIVLPTLWFGGPWLSSFLLRSIDWVEVLPDYAATLAITYFAIIVMPLIHLIRGLLERPLKGGDRT